MPCICVSLCKLWIVNFQRQNTGTQHNKQKLDSTQDFTSRNGKIRLNIHISIDLNRINKWEISMPCFFFCSSISFVVVFRILLHETWEFLLHRCCLQFSHSVWEIMRGRKKKNERTNERKCNIYRSNNSLQYRFVSFMRSCYPRVLCVMCVCGCVSVTDAWNLQLLLDTYQLWMLCEMREECDEKNAFYKKKTFYFRCVCGARLSAAKINCGARLMIRPSWWVS